MQFSMDYKYVLKGLTLFIVGCLVLLTIFRWNTKSRAFRVFKNMNITYGKYLEFETRGRGQSMLRYEFTSREKRFEGRVSSATFTNSNPLATQEFIVVYNFRNPDESTMFFNLKVNDSIKHYFKNGSLNKIPIDSYQRTIDSMYYVTFFKGVAKFFPPYFSKEDFPELEYLWEEGNK